MEPDLKEEPLTFLDCGAVVAASAIVNQTLRPDLRRAAQNDLEFLGKSGRRVEVAPDGHRSGRTALQAHLALDNAPP